MRFSNPHCVLFQCMQSRKCSKQSSAIFPRENGTFNSNTEEWRARGGARGQIQCRHERPDTIQKLLFWSAS